MKQPLRAATRRPVLVRTFPWLLLAILALVPLALQSAAQDATDKTEKDKQKPPASTDRTKPDSPPPPVNPIVQYNPQNGSGNDNKHFDKDGNPLPGNKKPPMKDYRSDSDDPRLSKPTKDLPIYGYDYFEPARLYYQARRNAYLNTITGFDGQGRRPARPGSVDELSPDSPSGRNANRRNSRDEIDSANDGSNRVKPRRSDSESDMSSDRKSPKAGGSANDGSDNSDETTSTGRKRSVERDNGTDTGDPETPDDANKSKPGARRTPGDVNVDNTDGIDLSVLTAAEYEIYRQRRAALGFSTPPQKPRTSRSDRTPEGTDEIDPDTGRPIRRRSSYPSANTLPSDLRYTNSDIIGNTGRDLNQLPQYPPSFSAFGGVADPFVQLARNVFATVPTSYQLSGGDVLVVRYSSPTLSAREFTGSVDPQGSFAIEDHGRLVVRSMTLAQAENAIKERLKRIYKNVDVSVSLKELRTINVTVSGEAFAPGGYNVPAVITAFNMLSAAGGPKITGSLRSIEILRQGKSAGTLDVYKILSPTDGDKGNTGNLQLQDGDVLYIPPALSHVAVRGEVRQPAQFELIEGETLQDALRYAKGAKPSGVSQVVQITTVDPGNARVLKNVDMRETAQVKNTPLYDGDLVDVFSLRLELANKVSVEGAVNQPNDYPLQPGMHVADLIALARGPLDEAYLPHATLSRWTPDNKTTLIDVDLEKALAHDAKANIELTKWDKLKVYTRQEVAWTGQRKVTVRGAVQRPGLYDHSDNMHVRDLMLMVGGPNPDAYLDRAVLLHKHGDDPPTYEFVRLSDAMNGDKIQNATIQDDDVFAVYRQSEAQFTPDHVVTILGEVVGEGVYPRGAGMRLSDLILLSGGFKPSAGSAVSVAHARKPADIPGSGPQKVSVLFGSNGKCAPQDDIMLEDGDVVTVQGTGGFIDRVQRVIVKGAVNKPGPLILTGKNMRLSDAIREAGGTRPEAFLEGAEFFRNPKMLASSGQRDLIVNISELSNLLNASAYGREKQKGIIELIRATGNANQGSSLLPLGAGGAAAATPNAAAPALAGQLSENSLVSAPRTLKKDTLEPNGNIAINLTEALHRAPGNSEDILLMDGDTLIVPEKPTTIQVVGAVVNGRGVLFKEGARLDYYVEQAGGYAPDAAKDRIVIVHAGGGLIPASKIKELRPGDVILVPTKVLVEKISSGRNGVDDFFRALTSSAIIFRLSTSLFGL